MKGNVLIRNPDGDGYLLIVGPPNPECVHVTHVAYGRDQVCRHYPNDHAHITEHADTWGHEFDGGEADPAPWEIVPALAHTEWTCPWCGDQNDVWGEGAINNWMECSGCQRNMWLSLDLYLMGKDWEPPPSQVRS